MKDEQQLRKKNAFAYIKNRLQQISLIYKKG